MIAAAAGVIVLATIATVLLALRDRPSALDRAAARVDRDAGWATAPVAGETLASVGEDLLSAGVACGSGARCDALLSASAWAQASAVRVLRCARPGVVATRADAAHLIEGLQRRRRVTLPPVPRC